MSAHTPRIPALSTRHLAGTAIALIAVFPVTVVTLNLIQHRNYDTMSDAVSLLALGRAGTALDIAFFMLGIGIGLLALVLRQSVQNAIAGPILLTVAGLAAFASGIFHTNANGAPTTIESNIHMFAGITVFLTMVATMFVFAWRFRLDPKWRGFAAPTLIWAAAGAVTFLLIPILGDARFGLAQRLHIATWLSWALVTGLRARSLTLRAETFQPAALTVSASHWVANRTTRLHGTHHALADLDDSEH